MQRTRRIFNLDADLEAATQRLDPDPIIGSFIRSLPGIRALGTWDPFETGLRAIVGQQVSVAGAGTITARLVARYGIPVPGLRALGLSYVFPSPSILANPDLSGLGLTSSRCAAINAFARAVADKVLHLDRGSSLGQFVESVTAIPGLGPWTAHYLALRLGEPDAFPSADLGIRRALAPASGKPLTPREAEAMAERWRPWRAHAAIHLWLGRH